MPKKSIVFQEGKKEVPTITQFETFSGSLPPPEKLAEYDKVLSNGAERLLKVFEQQVTHRMELANKGLELANKEIEFANKGLELKNKGLEFENKGLELANKEISIDQYSVEQHFKQSGRGQRYGFFIALVGIGVSACLPFYGHDTIAGIFGTTTIVGLVAVFVIEKKRKEKGNTH